jgi:hypothetical protein
MPLHKPSFPLTSALGLLSCIHRIMISIITFTGGYFDLRFPHTVGISGPPCSGKGDLIRGPGLPGWGRVSRIGTIKYGIESRGTALAGTSSNSKLQTRPLIREGATK